MTIIELIQVLPTYDVPPSEAPPEMMKVNTVVSWGLYIVGILAFLAFVFVGVRMMWNNKHGQSTDENMRGLTGALVGCLVIAAAGGISGALIG